MIGGGLACAALSAVLSVSMVSVDGGDGESGRSSRISDDAVALIEPESFPRRPKPLIEIGNPFLGSGDIDPGFGIPGGARWQPSFIAFGTLRSALQVVDADSQTSSEWANRLDLFGNLQLTGTERVLIGFRPMERPGTLSGYSFRPEAERGFQEDWNGELQALFFEGDLGELFPNLDPDDSGSWDLGFAVGRQPFLPQDGVLMADSIDALGVIRNTLLPRGGSDLQLTGIWGWNSIHRGDGVERDGQMLFGLFTAADYPRRTLYLDTLWAYDRSGQTDGLFWGVSSVQRLGHTNATFRALGSHALEQESAAVSDGFLLMSELSWTPAWTHDIIYFNAFWALEHFKAAARGPGAGGPLGRVGVLFAPVGVGSLGAALDAEADRAFGGAAGYQMFLAGPRRQLVLEAAVREETDTSETSGGFGARLRQALGRRFIVQLDAFGAFRDSAKASWGARFETLIQF